MKKKCKEIYNWKEGKVVRKCKDTKLGNEKRRKK